jgi:hypothetical protein
MAAKEQRSARLRVATLPQSKLQVQRLAVGLKLGGLGVHMQMKGWGCKPQQTSSSWPVSFRQLL